MGEPLDRRERSERSRSHTHQLRVVGKELRLIKICIKTGAVKATAHTL